ncbi:MAG TPA: hypothetical protein VJQ79_08455 [Acidimicrobiia bacterium]|nr:hypothetical protein [Acidimicrobiia bacterium]
MARYRIALVAMLAAMAIPTVALAGGWAMASFDNVPAEFEAGTTYDLEYTILQHGQTPVDVASSQVRFVDSDGTVVAADAVATGNPGRYTVSITIPEAGSWHWSVTMGEFGDHEMGTVEVTQAVAAAAATGSVVRWLLPLALVLVLGLVAAQVADLVKTRRSARPIRAD